MLFSGHCRGPRLSEQKIPAKMKGPSRRANLWRIRDILTHDFSLFQNRCWEAEGMDHKPAVQPFPSALGGCTSSQESTAALELLRLFSLFREKGNKKFIVTASTGPSHPGGMRWGG